MYQLIIIENNFSHHMTYVNSSRWQTIYCNIKNLYMNIVNSGNIVLSYFIGHAYGW